MANIALGNQAAGSQVATRDLEPPCQVAVHQRTNLVPRRVPWIAVFLWGEPGNRSADGREGWRRDSMGVAVVV